MTEHFFDSESDSELQAAFASGQLKPGLNIPVVVVKREAVNNVEPNLALLPRQNEEEFLQSVTGMNQRLDDVKLNMKWIERLDMINNLAPMTPEIRAQLGEDDDKPSDEDSHNEFKQEMNFYRQAQAAVLQAIPKLSKLGIQTKRPMDYFAEMAKSDNQMQKIREKLLSKQNALERSQKLKKLRELRKHGKKIHQEVMQQRQKDKKDMMEAVKRYRKGDKTSLNFLENDGKNKGSGPPSKNKRLKSTEKRKLKESKYGYGGKKKRSKYNTATSSADMTGFDSRRNSKAKARPGKARRQNMKNRKKR